MEVFLGGVAAVFLGMGTWMAKKVIEHDRALSVRDHRLEMVLEKVEDIRAYLRENKPFL